MRVRLLNSRHDDVRCKGNMVIMTLAEAAKRWSETGQFDLSETTDVSNSELKDTEVATADLGGFSTSYSKIETALAGLDIMNTPTVDDEIPPIVKEDPEPVEPVKE